MRELIEVIRYVKVVVGEKTVGDVGKCVGDVYACTIFNQ